MKIQLEDKDGVYEGQTPSGHVQFCSLGLTKFLGAKGKKVCLNIRTTPAKDHTKVTLRQKMFVHWDIPSKDISGFQPFFSFTENTLKELIKNLGGFNKQKQKNLWVKCT